MRALIQRVKSAHVAVDQHVVGQIEQGLLVFVGLGKNDSLATAEKLLKKI